MAKRRPVGAKAAAQEEEEEEANETPQERRERRERERRAKKRRGGPSAALTAGWPRWKKVAVVGGGILAVAAAVAITLALLPPPCLTLSAPPLSSGVPDESAPSWCVNSTDAITFQTSIDLQIVVGGSQVVIPGGIGVIPQSKWGYSCDMPIYTSNATGPGGTDSGGVILIASPWSFTYTLEDFFNVWKESYSTVTVAGTPQSISYTGAGLFNYTSNDKQAVRLWVDGSQSNAGPLLVLTDLAGSFDNSAAIPQCYLTEHGSGHSIVITWGWVGSGEASSGPTILHAPEGPTAPLPTAVPPSAWHLPTEPEVSGWRFVQAVPSPTLGPGRPGS